MEKQQETEAMLPRGSDKVTAIEIGGIRLNVKTTATPATLKQIRDLVNAKFEVFEDTLEKGMDPKQLAVLVAFHLAEDLLEEREKQKEMKRRLIASTDALISRVESSLDSGA